MKYAIITPTFEPHFKYVEKYLESYKKFVQDKDDITIIFTISKNEADQFKIITDKYCNNINYETLYFEDILKHFNIALTPDELLIKYKKFTFQTLKKFYTMLYSDADRFLVLDSESMWIRDTNMKELFEEYYNKPFIASSSLVNRKTMSNFMRGVIDNTNLLLETNCERWFLENFVWFYDKNILKDLFNKFGSPIEMTERIYELRGRQRIESGIFEIELYQAFIYQNLEKYNYKHLDIDEILKNALSEELFKVYMESYHKKFGGNCGLLEHSMVLLKENNCEALAKLFNKYNFNIIRCEYTHLGNVKIQEKFLDVVNPNILAASQEHAFGIYNKFQRLVYINKYSKILDRHLLNLKKSKKLSINLIIEPLLLILYYIKWYLCVIKDVRKYKKLYQS